MHHGLRRFSPVFYYHSMGKRSLPILQTSADQDNPLVRPGWHWIVIGAAFVFVFWMPLVVGAEWLIPWLDRMAPGADGTLTAVWLRGALVVVPLLGSIGLAAAGGLFLVGFLGQGAQRHHMALSGALAVAAAWILALVGGSLEPWWIAVSSLLALVGTAVPFALLGGSLGHRWARRGQGAPPRPPAPGVAAPSSAH